MRKALVAMTALSAALLCADGASSQIAVGPVRVSADRLPMSGDDPANYWGVGGGTASAATSGIEHGAPQPDKKPHVDDGRK